MNRKLGKTIISRRSLIFLGIATSAALFCFHRFKINGQEIVLNSDHIALKTFLKNAVINSDSKPSEFGTDNVVILENFLLPQEELLGLTDAL